MKKILQYIATIIFALMFSFSFNLISNASIGSASSCSQECLGAGVCQDNPEGGILCNEGVRPDGFPYCENSPCPTPPIK